MVVATDPATAASLVPGLTAPAMHSVTTWYHSTEGSTLAGGHPVLVVDGQRRGPVVNTVVMSHASPSYAPAGHALVATSVLGTDTGEGMARDVRRHLAVLYGCDATAWEEVAVYPIAEALPVMTVPHDFTRPVRRGDRLFVAGDHLDSSSIQGAMVSGRRAAQAILRERGAR